jgi:tRNA (guanine37-N1)-methyltransferase
LPEELCKGSPSGFAITGHLGERDDLRVFLPLISPSAHMNLNKEYLPYKHMIGQIVLDESIDSSNPELPLMPFTTEKSYDYNSCQ